MQLSTALMALLGLTSTVLAATGINCKGSSMCKNAIKKGNLQDLLYQAYEIQQTDPNKEWGEKENIVSRHSITAFTQGSDRRININLVVERLEQLYYDGGCERCGSIALDGPDGDQGQGMLTVNYKTN